MTIIVDYIVTVLSDKTIRVLFQEEVNPSNALTISNYAFSVLPGTSYLPSLVEAKSFNTDNRQYELIFSESFTHTSVYSVQISGVSTPNGDGVVTPSAHNWTANVPAGAVPLLCIFSILGHCDLVFDREVGQYSSGASGSITNGVDPSDSLILVPWNSSIPLNNVRFQIPATVDSGDEWYVSFIDILDISQNQSLGTIKLSVPDTIPKPLTYSEATTIRTTNSFLTNYNYYFGFNNIRLFFNFATNASVYDTTNYNIYQIETHLSPDNYHFVTEPDCTNLVEFCDLLNDIKLQYNKHLLAPGVHLIRDPSQLVVTQNAMDMESAYLLILDLYEKYRGHAESESLHNSKDGINLPNDGLPIKAATVLYDYANSLKASFNSHLTIEYLVPFVSYPFLGAISSDFSSFPGNPLNSISSWSADLRVKSRSPRTQYRIECTVSSEDGSSTTDLLTGTSLVKSASSEASLISHTFLNTDSVVITSDHEFFNFENQYEYKNEGKALEYEESEEYSSIQSLLWALQEAWIQYDSHRTNQSHYFLDTINFVSGSDIPTIDTIVDSVNKLRDKYLNHKIGAKWHNIPDDSYFKAAYATDIHSAIKLLSKIRSSMNHHTNNGVLHNGSSQEWISAPLFDSIVFRTGYQKIDADLTLEFPAVVKVVYLGAPSNIFFEQRFSYTFKGVGFNPHISDVVPIPAVSWYRQNSGYSSDNLQVFFSKKMEELSLDNVSILPVTPGDSIYINRRMWISENVIELGIAGMSAALYTLNISGISDKAGNQVS